MTSSRLPIMIISLFLVAGCGQPGTISGESSQDPAPAPSSARTGSATPEEPPATSRSPEPVRNDLESGKLNRKLESGDVSLRVTYSTSLPVAEWTATTTKPFGVSATASLTGKNRTEKIYLSKLTVSLDPKDAAGSVEPPQQLTDEAAIVPGFLVVDPASYGQEFFIPGLASGTTSLTLRIRYELLLETTTDAQSENRDYARRTVTDTLIVPIAAG